MVILVIVILLGVIFAPALKRSQQKAQRITCSGHNMMLGTAYRIWANDHGNLMPAQTSISNGGWSELLTKSGVGQYCWTNYATLREELGESSKILVCPADERKPAANFIVKGTTSDIGNAAFKDNTAVSYFVGVSANDTDPQSIIGGDRNLGPGFIPDPNYGYSPPDGKGNDVVISTNSPISWSLKMHSHGHAAGVGNIMLGDGSVQQVSSATFTLLPSWPVVFPPAHYGLRDTETGTNFSGKNQVGIRLVFP